MRQEVPQTITLVSNYEDTSDKPRLEDTVQDTWLTLLKTVTVMNNKRLRNRHRPERLVAG